MQGGSQPHSPWWARVTLSSFFPQITINFSYFSSNFAHFCDSPSRVRVAHPGRPWLRHCPHAASMMQLWLKSIRACGSLRQMSTYFHTGEHGTKWSQCGVFSAKPGDTIIRMLCAALKLPTPFYDLLIYFKLSIPS